MAKIKWDVSGSDPDKAVSKEFVQPKPGVYVAVLVEAPAGFKKVDGVEDKSAPRIEAVYEIKGVLKAPKTEGDVVGARLFDYIPLASKAAEWKLDQFLQAFGVATAKKRKGVLDTDTLVGMPCRIRVKGETYEGEYRAKVGAVMKGEDDDLDTIAEQEAEEEGEIEDEPEEEETEDEAEEEEEAVSYTAEELAEFTTVKDLAAVCKDLDLTPPKDIQKKPAALRDWIFENQPNPPSDEEVEDEEESEDEEPSYETWELAALKKELEERGLATNGKKADLVKRLVADDNEDPFG